MTTNMECSKTHPDKACEGAIVNGKCEEWRPNGKDWWDTIATFKLPIGLKPHQNSCGVLQDEYGVGTYSWMIDTFLKRMPDAKLYIFCEICDSFGIDHPQSYPASHCSEVYHKNDEPKPCA